MAKKRKATATDASTNTTTTAKKAKTAVIPGRSKPAPATSHARPITRAKSRQSGGFSEAMNLDSDYDEFVVKNPASHVTNSSLSSFYSSNNSTSSSTPAQQNLNKLFDHYRDQPRNEPDKILVDGAQSYLSDLSIALDEVVLCALCDLLSCASVGEFERESFISGWLSASTSAPSPGPRSNTTGQPLDTIPKQKSHISTLRKLLTSDPTYFKTIYRSAFKLAKPETQRSIPIESALEFWKMFFSSSSGGIDWNTESTKWLDLWLEFYGTQSKRPVNKDLWNMVGELVIKTKAPDGESLDWWTEDGAWPMAVDEFVGWVKEKRKAAGEDAMDIS
jgi:DCN1-like protein 1/2